MSCTVRLLRRAAARMRSKMFFPSPGPGDSVHHDIGPRQDLANRVCDLVRDLFRCLESHVSAESDSKIHKVTAPTLLILTRSTSRIPGKVIGPSPVSVSVRRAARHPATHRSSASRAASSHGRRSPPRNSAATGSALKSQFRLYMRASQTRKSPRITTALDQMSVLK